jgi:hypothetical protein
VEAALSIATLAAMLVLCLGGVMAIVLQVRCVDAAREAARLAARADGASGSAVAASLVPPGAAMELRREGGFYVVRVSGRAPMLPGVVIAAEAVAAAEPGR